jgi:hypothetical protein
MADIIKIDSRYQNDARPWSESDISDLRFYVGQRRPIADAAKFLGRHPNKIAQKANDLGLVFREDTLEASLARLQLLETEAGPLVNSEEMRRHTELIEKLGEALDRGDLATARKLRRD